MMMRMVVVENYDDDDHGHDYQNFMQLKLNLMQFMQFMQLATTQQKSRNFTQLTQLVGVHQCPPNYIFRSLFSSSRLIKR